MRSRSDTPRHAEPAPPGDARSQVAGNPVVIEAVGVRKSFEIPMHKVDSLKERVTHPFNRVGHRRLEALRDVSFDVRQGEFFGIVGRNGSGKSSLLKIMASIYRADAGRVRTAGRVAPFIELGVGFNPELTARENGALNGVLMGLTLRQARRRLDSVLDFAELRDFVDLKLKNYSSGMMVRFAFALMVEADADIMLIDEVLAVGDAAFSQKCMDVFHERKRAGKTVVLVTHDMGTVQAMCHRAMLLHDGELRHIGDPEETAMEYFRLNFAGPPQAGGAPIPPDAERATVDLHYRVEYARLLDEFDRPTENLEQGTPINLDAVMVARRPLTSPTFLLHIVNEDGVVVSGLLRPLDERLVAGQELYLRGRIDNLLVPGRYFIDCWIRQDGEGGDMAVQGVRLLTFVVYGTAARHGFVSLPAELEPSAGAVPSR